MTTTTLLFESSAFWACLLLVLLGVSIMSLAAWAEMRWRQKRKRDWSLMLATSDRSNTLDAEKALRAMRIDHADLVNTTGSYVFRWDCGNVYCYMDTAIDPDLEHTSVLTPEEFLERYEREHFYRTVGDNPFRHV